MTQTSKAPAGSRAGASRDSFAGPSRYSHTLEAHRAQFLIRTHATQPDMAVMLAAIIFEGGAQ